MTGLTSLVCLSFFLLLSDVSNYSAKTQNILIIKENRTGKVLCFIYFLFTFLVDLLTLCPITFVVISQEH